MKVVVSTERCVGGGQCVVAAPTVFDQGDDGIVILQQDNPPAALRDSVRDAAILCPAAAITLIEP